MLHPILCPVRNGVQYTKDALPTFLAQDCGDITVFFVENESKDGTREYLNSQDTSRVKVSHQTPGLSVAASWNLGLRWLFDNGADHVFVVNNDVELRPDMYSALLETGLPFVTGVGVKTKEQMNEHYVRQDRPRPDFSAYLIHRVVWQKVGPFNEEFAGAFAEDCDYHVRGHRSGIRFTCCGFPYLHHASQTVKLASPEDGKRICEQADKNRALFKSMYGCEVGSPAYEDLFKEEDFGMYDKIKALEGHPTATEVPSS